MVVGQPCNLSPQRWGAGVSQTQAPSWLQVKSKAILGYGRHSQEGKEGRLHLGQPHSWREERAYEKQMRFFVFLNSKITDLFISTGKCELRRQREELGRYQVYGCIRAENKQREHVRVS